ncbi:uncharacterized protein LACBIDRAFT_329864 [Laccaria bicolor S238N-H82]|uniref:Predicted protein n=1 Tax=Laccaria bicolor (strain S238N-H82 / ATCC MYA-4686) TaxID=486041 RepID=B0DJH3_LACBS|nr:uncharacterized protein LACBIDRAFT_329864 [Laccaria bicolor S238N-H82]EDR05120.1 predicted protein [Laccaria bicolor S238N-H82]|eukprot:XP_001884085.1 predicted protein [Laccaria bicolor S238N-H82]
MSEIQARKRRRSLREDSVDVSKIRQIVGFVNALQEEYADIDETEVDLAKMMEHMEKMYSMMKKFKKIKVSFSNASAGDLQNLGVNGKVERFAQRRAKKFDEELKDLRSRVQEIYSHVNMTYEASARMVLDAILLSLGKITQKNTPNKALAIIPEMKQPDALFTHQTHQVIFGGSIDYGIIEYTKDANNDNFEFLIGASATPESILRFAREHFILVEAKREVVVRLVESIPEAVTQAMTVSANAKSVSVFSKCALTDVRWSAPTVWMPSAFASPMGPNFSS